MKVLLDTGSAKIFTSETHFLEKYPRNKRLFPVPGIEVVAAQGDACEVVGAFTVKILVQTEMTRLQVLVVRHLQHRVILGIDFLHNTHAKIDFHNEAITLDMTPENRPAIPPVSVDLAEAKLNAVEKKKLQQTLNEFRELFSAQPGLTHVITHEIETGDSPPIKARPYRYDQVKDRIIQAHIEEMLANNIITPIFSPWASPVVLCRKKTTLPLDDPKAWRFAVDYRALNKVTQFPSYPMPLIDDILHSLKQVQYMSTLDLTSGYFQLALREDDIPKTAFVTKYGAYAFRRLAFGLNGPPASFQKPTDCILQPILGKKVFVYLNDIIIANGSFDDHIHTLRKVFTLLKEAGLTANLLKNLK